MGHFTISLNGRSYRLRCGDGEEERLAELAAYIEHRLDDLAMASGQYGDERLLLMVTVLLADELLDLKARVAEMQTEAAHAAPPEAADPPLFPVPDAGLPHDPFASVLPDAADAPVLPREEAAADVHVETSLPASPGTLSRSRSRLEARLAEAREGRPPPVPRPVPSETG